MLVLYLSSILLEVVSSFLRQRLSLFFDSSLGNPDRNFLSQFMNHFRSHFFLQRRGSPFDFCIKCSKAFKVLFFSSLPILLLFIEQKNKRKLQICLPPPFLPCVFLCCWRCEPGVAYLMRSFITKPLHLVRIYCKTCFKLAPLPR